MININVLAKSTFTILAVIALVSVISYSTTGIEKLFEFAKSIVIWVLIGSVAIAAFIHGPRLIGALR